LYTADFQAVIEHHNLRLQFYGDHVQINGSAKPSVVPQLQSQLLDCIDDVAGCMRCNRLQLNTAKTKIMWCSTSRRQHQLPTIAVRVRSPGRSLGRGLMLTALQNHCSTSFFCIARLLLSV
jgi:hypothetical protein